MLYFKTAAMGCLAAKNWIIILLFIILSVNKEALNSGNLQLRKQDEPNWKPVKLTGPGKGEVSI